MKINSMFIYDPLVDGEHPPTEIGAKAEIGATLNSIDMMETLISCTFEDSTAWYFVVFKPFNKPYENDPDWFKVKGLDSCRKHFKNQSALILTREVNAEKVHINAIVCTSTPPKHDGIYNNKYKLHVSLLSTLGDRQRTLTYITKEFADRETFQYLDYYISK